jgi:hypothetical protein
MIDLIKDESNKEPSSIRKEWTLHMFDILGNLKGERGEGGGEGEDMEKDINGVQL